MSQSRRSRSKEAPRRRETLGTAIACNLEDAAGHTSPASADHPESQERLKCIVDHLKAVGLWDKCQFLDMPPAVDEGDLQQTHDKEYIASMAATERQSQDDLNQLASSFDSVYLCQGSYRASTSAVTCTRHLAESIVENKMRNGFALVRPPGHHAQKAHANGYCVFNSAASAAEAAFNFGAERILIVDFDVHHGQGTQQIFYEDERILYFSIHRYENGAYWPHLRESNFDFIGEGRGSGFNVNVPLNEVGCDNADYSAVFWSVLWPIANEFNPDLVIISAGFDACIGDPLGGMAVTPAFFGHMVYHLSDFAQGKIMLALEGGYNRNMLPVCVENCVRVLLGEQPTQIPPIGAAKESTIASILNVISVLRKYWRCFDFYSTASAKCKWDRHDTVVEYSPKLSTPTGPIDQRTLLCPEKLVPSPLEKERTTALAYDPLMTRHHNETEHHVECPERITSIYEQLNEGGLVEQCVKLEGRLATEAELELVHDRPHVRRMKRTATLSAAERRREEDNFNSIYFSPDSFDCALRSCGGVLQVNSLLSSSEFSCLVGL
uniref:Histone deacetylase domain-containing protein n=1 Tax=Plectus sambesii TaxID=2011161 RepID=A0A914XAH6_9BILA